MNERNDQFKRATEQWKTMEVVDKTRHPMYLDAWERGCSRNPGDANKWQNILDAMLARDLAMIEVFGQPVRTPEVEPARAIPFGMEIATGRDIAIHENIGTRHIGYFGSSGSGKTTGMASAISTLYDREKQIIFSCRKDEGRRLPNLFKDVLIIRANQVPENLLESPARSASILYLSEVFQALARSYGLLPINSTQMVSVAERLERGLQPGSPYFSCKDLERTLHKEGERDRKKFITSAYAVGALNTVLGPTAFIRRGNKPKARIIVYEWHGLDSRSQQFLSSVLLLRTQMEAMAHGHSEGLRLAFFSDEAGIETKASTLPGQIPILERQVSQMRSYNMGVFYGAQSVCDMVEGAISNTATFVAFRTPHPRDVKRIGELLRLSSDQMAKLPQLPPGEAFLLSEGFSGPCHVKFPFVDLGDYPSDEKIERLMAPRLAVLEEGIVRAPAGEDAPPIYFTNQGEAPTGATEPVSPSAPVDTSWSADHATLLRDIDKFPDASVTERYRRVKFGGSKGDRIKNALLAQSLIAEVLQPQASGAPRKLLRLTEAGRQRLSASC